MRTRVLAPALLLALAACEGGSAGGNTADEESAGQPVVQQAVPENLTDDPRNEAIPIEPPAKGPVPLTATVPVEAFPAGFQGRWGLVAADCEPGRADAKGLMVVGPRTLRFYESRATATALGQSSPARVEARLDFTGEGREWRRTDTLTLADDRILVREERNPATSLRYARCPA